MYINEWILDDGYLDATRYKILDAGYWMRDTRYWMQDWALAKSESHYDFILLPE
jgi:hypothetical protein